MHPLWIQVAALDNLGKPLEAAQSLQPAMEWDSRPLPPAFTPPTAIPPDLARERQRRIEADARRYVQQLEEFLTQRAKDVLTRVERSERKAMEARLVAERTKRIEERRAANLKQAEALQNLITRAEYRDVALQSQIRSFKGQSRLDAQIQHNQLLTRIAGLNQEREKFLADVRPQVDREMEPLRKQALAALEEEMRKRRAASDRTIAESLEQARERILAEAEAIPALEKAVQKSDLPKATPVPPPAAPDPAALIPARKTLETAQAAQRLEREAQRNRLLEIIRADTRKAVEQVARREGWKLAPAGTRGDPDRTEAVANALRSQWKPATP